MGSNKAGMSRVTQSLVLAAATVEAQREELLALCGNMLATIKVNMERDDLYCHDEVSEEAFNKMIRHWEVTRKKIEETDPMTYVRDDLGVTPCSWDTGKHDEHRDLVEALTKQNEKLRKASGEQ